MLALWEYFWTTADWLPAPVVPPPPPEPGSGGAHGPHYPKYQPLPQDYWDVRKKALIAAIADIHTEEDMRKNADLEKENAELKKASVGTTADILELRQRIAALATENADLRDQMAVAIQHLSNPVVQAVLSGDWEAVRSAMLEQGAKSSPQDLLGLARALRNT